MSATDLAHDDDDNKSQTTLASERPGTTLEIVLPWTAFCDGGRGGGEI